MKPSPAPFALLEQAIHDSRALLVNAALSDAPGTLEIQAFADKPEFASHHVDYQAVGDVVTIEIAAHTGSEEMERLGLTHVDLLKIDTEGHDLSVLQGFDQALKNGAIDVIQFEYNYTSLIAGKSLKMFFDLLSPDYVLCRLLPNGLEICAYHPILDDFTQTNWVAIRKPMLDEQIMRHFAIRPARGIIQRDLAIELQSEPELKQLILG